jgi:hypothetical protein
LTVKQAIVYSSHRTNSFEHGSFEKQPHSFSRNSRIF